MLIHDCTLQADGWLYSRRQHETEHLAPQAVEIFCGMLRTGSSFRAPVPSPSPPHIELRWDQVDGAAMASFFSRGELVTVSALLSDHEAEPERLWRELIERVSGRPAPELPIDRPLIATLPLRAVPDLPLIADMETCLAAAFFLGLPPANS